MSAINPPQAVALRDIRTDDVVTIESGDDELGSTITGRVHGVDTCKTAILLGDQIWYSLADGSDWRYVSGYRRVPEVEPGTVGTAFISPNGERDTVMRIKPRQRVSQGATFVWVQAGGSYLTEGEVEDFQPDPDPAALRAEVERLNGLIAMADRMGAQITQERNDLHAEVERLSAVQVVDVTGMSHEQIAALSSPEDAEFLVAADEQAAEGSWGTGAVDDHETYAPMNVETAPAAVRLFGALRTAIASMDRKNHGSPIGDRDTDAIESRRTILGLAVAIVLEEHGLDLTGRGPLLDLTGGQS